MLITFAQRGTEGRICRFGYLMEARVPCVARMRFLFAPELGREEWSIVITAGGDWKIAEGMDDWCESRAREARREFDVLAARLSKDRRYILLVCNPHTYTYNIICSFNLATKTVLIDGDTVEEQPDGTILVKDKKTYLNDEDGEPLGAAWYDLWMTPDGEVVRKTEPVRRNL